MIKDLDVAFKKCLYMKVIYLGTLFFNDNDIEKFVAMHKINSVISYN